MLILPFPCDLELPNGLELSCPAEAGRLTWIVRPAGGPGKLQSRPSPPGQSAILVFVQGFSELII
jgi:hypothetical protein